MKESKFIEKNKKNWQEYENNLRYNKNKATRLSNLFVQITDDLSFANTYYRFRSVKIYLNGIAQSLYNDLYRNSAGSWKAFIRYWKTDLPLYVHEARVEFRVSFIIFFISVCIGVLSSIYDKNFASFILGEDYIKTTLENIKNNDPMGIYKSGASSELFLHITLNNLRVALLTYVLGMFFSIGTILFIIHNGVMLGTFQYFFIERGLATQSFLTIWQHGTIEISCIIIAGAAGILMGKGFVFPRTYKRTDAFKLSAIRGLKIFTGVAPLFIIAAFIEGFLTRHTSINNYARLAVIVLSLAFILFYFVWYPWYISKRKVVNAEIKPEEVKFIKPLKFDFSKILNAQEMFGYTIKAIMQNKLFVLGYIFIASFISSFLLTMVEYIENPVFFKQIYFSLGILFNYNSKMLIFVIGTLVLTVAQMFFYKTIYNHVFENEPIKLSWQNYVNMFFSYLLTSAILIVPFWTNTFWTLISMILVVPVVLVAGFITFYNKQFIFFTFGKTFKFISQSWGKLFWNSIKIYGFFTAFYFLFNSIVSQFFIKNIYPNFSYSEQANYIIEAFIFSFITFSLYILFYLIHIINSIINYKSFNEVANAESLHQRIEKFGERNIMFGFDKEQQK